MATIILEGTAPAKGDGKGQNQRAFSVSATVARVPDRLHQATINGKRRDFEFVGVDGSGNRIYRDQNRRGKV